MSGKALTSWAIGCAAEQAASDRTSCRHALHPEEQVAALRDKIKAKVRETPTGFTLADLIDDLNPVIIGWRNYYRYATRAWREFAKNDWWLYWRLKSWLGKKHGKASARKLRRIYTESGGKSSGWRMGEKSLPGLLMPSGCCYPDRGLRIPNGWNATPDEHFLKGADKFWEATNALASL